MYKSHPTEASRKVFAMALGRDLNTVPADKRCTKCKTNKRMMNKSLCALCAQEKKAGGNKK